MDHGSSFGPAGNLKAGDVFRFRSLSDEGRIADSCIFSATDRPAVHTHIPTSKTTVPSRELTYPPYMAYLKMIFLFPRWGVLVSWRVTIRTDVHRQWCENFQHQFDTDIFLNLRSDCEPWNSWNHGKRGLLSEWSSAQKTANQPTKRKGKQGSENETGIVQLCCIWNFACNKKKSWHVTLNDCFLFANWKLRSLRILDLPMEGWTNLYDAGLGSLKIGIFEGPMILRDCKYCWWTKSCTSW